MKKTLFFFLSLSLIVLPIISQAAASAPGLVTCGYTRDCTLDDLLGIPGKIIDVVVNSIAPGLGVIFIIVGAAYMIFAAGSPEKFNTGKKILIISIVGLILSLGARLVISTIISIMGAQNVGTP